MKVIQRMYKIDLSQYPFLCELTTYVLKIIFKSSFSVAHVYKSILKLSPKVKMEERIFLVILVFSL